MSNFEYGVISLVFVIVIVMIVICGFHIGLLEDRIHALELKNDNQKIIVRQARIDTLHTRKIIYDR